MTKAQQGPGGKRGAKPGAAALRARAVLMVASGVPTERISEAVGLSVKTIQNIASEHAEEIREAAGKVTSGVVAATVDASADALKAIRGAAPEAAEKLLSLMRDGGNKETAAASAVELRAAEKVLALSGIVPVTKAEVTGANGGAIATVVRFPVNELGNGERRQ